METDDIILAIRAIEDTGVRLSAIEKELNIPRNNLSAVLNKKKPMGKRWQRKLTEYVLNYQLQHDKLPGMALADLLEKGVAITKVTPQGETSSVEPFSEKGQEIIQQAKTGQKLPPAGLSKTEMIRWHRTNSQTLE